MERRLFVKKTSMVSMGILAFSGAKIFANNTTEKKENTVIDLLPISKTSNKIIVKGMIIDALTSQPIDNCIINVTTKTNRLFNTTKEIKTSNGDYSIVSGFAPEGKITRKIKIKITAPGYKTYNSQIYISKNGCNLHSDEWNYNKNFNIDDCPKNMKLDNETISVFNFKLVK